MFKIAGNNKGMSRRGFLKGAGITAAGAAIAETGLATLAQAAENGQCVFAGAEGFGFGVDAIVHR